MHIVKIEKVKIEKLGQLGLNSGLLTGNTVYPTLSSNSKAKASISSHFLMG